MLVLIDPCDYSLTLSLELLQLVDETAMQEHLLVDFVLISLMVAS